MCVILSLIELNKNIQTSDQDGNIGRQALHPHAIMERIIARSQNK